MKDYNDYKTARTIAREGCERTIAASLSWLSVDMMYEEFAANDREYLNIDMSEYSRIVEGWC